MNRACALQALVGVVIACAGVAFFDWRAAIVATGALLWVDTWRAAG